MDQDYDRKFEEMKKYIPFLESMIKRLESTSGAPGSANPRQAQLDKIRSLRDLLLDKKKRMKMENLLKCEQVLVNLYAKVEQRDTLPGIKPVSEIFSSTPSQSDSDLRSVRKKLKSVMSIKQEDTLPEIARLSETEESCTAGSKEPALFQRRPNKAQSPSRSSSAQSGEKISSQKSNSKRNYTRVLVSPEPNSQRWSTGEDTPQQTLFSRRSPPKSPKRYSPSYKKERRRSSNDSKRTKDLNITLNVPQDSLDSLNTDDILSRIIYCDDNDVDIATLRDVRTQILGELKQTGAREDISDIIMKSYKTKKKKKVLNVRKRDEVEEGELSDSESEAIESIYGSLVVVDKDKTTSVPSGTKDLIGKDNQSRKIQICLVINSDKDDKVQEVPKATDVSDFEMFDDVDIGKPTAEDKQTETMMKTKKSYGVSTKMERFNVFRKENASQVLVTIDGDDESKKTDVPQKNSSELEKPKSVAKKNEIYSNNSFIHQSSISEAENSLDKTRKRLTSHSEADNFLEKTKEQSTKIPAFKANFYKPLHDSLITESSKNTLKISDKTQSLNKESSLKSKTATEIKALELPSVNSDKKKEEEENGEKSSSSSAKCIPYNKSDVPESRDFTKDVEIPLLNTEPVVAAAPTKNVLSEIDILQALKNEILSESIAISGTDGSTPLLHQPKVTKVAGAQKIMNKKRISLEKYKQKSNFNNEPNALSRYYDYGKKQSLKLTKEERERFNLTKQLPLDYSSEDEDKDDSSVDDLYADLAPQSPENEDAVGSSTPIIIPVDPIKPTVVSSKIDVDMRVMPTLSPNSGRSLPVPHPPPLMSIVLPVAPVPPPVETKPEQSKRPLLMDPRMRRDFSKPVSKESPNPHLTNSERSTPSNYPNMTPSRAPSMTPNARTYEMMTSSHQSFDLEDRDSIRKHVYAPIATFESREREKCDGRETSTVVWETNFDSAKDGRKPRWEDREERDGNNSRSYWEEHERRSKRWDDSDKRGSATRDVSDYQKSRYEPSDRYQHSRSDRYSNTQRDDYYSRQERPRTPSHSFGRADRPTTPNPSFGRHEPPMTPIHLFGRSDCPTTPSHPFGRTEHPQTPSHPFGRSECPLTPSHPFGRTDVSLTHSQPFGRTECPMTPSHPFGRSECPLTPSHPFGRLDMNMAPTTPSHPFGRSDYQQNQPVLKFKDPRLNRSTEYDSQRRDNDKDRDHCRDRKKSDHSNRSHNAYYNYGHEQSVGGNDKDNNNDQRRKIRERTQHRESSDVRSLSKDGERCYTRRNVGCAHSPDDRYHRSSSRAPSVGNFQDTNNENTLSVKPQSGRSFIIDTSVNRTFQEFLNDKGLQLQVFDHSFESRRQRAASVGRTLTRELSVGRSRRESSVGRMLPKPAAATHDSLDYKRMLNFVRARSMGRDLGDRDQQKSLNEIKADFQSYSAAYNKKEYNRKIDQKGNTQAFRSRKDLHQMQQAKKHQQRNIKTTYSPRKNQRDPRMKREHHSYDSKNRNKHENKSTYGIVYSTDNIAKGTILGSGYGVKNYKIPKIKRPIEEIKKEESKVIEKQEKAKVEKSKANEKKIKDEKSKCVDKKIKSDDEGLKETIIMPKSNKKEKSTKSEIMEKDKKRPKEKNKVICEKTENKANLPDDVIKRLTRSGKKDVVESKTFDEVSGPKIRKVKKSVIESDSDSETKESKKTDINRTKVGQTNENVDLFNSSFGMDDLEIFPGSSGTAEVMANINDLIADLDKELENNKSAEDSNQFTQELSLENMLDNINSPESEYSKEKSVEESLQDISELINKDLKVINAEPASFYEKKQDIPSQAGAGSTSTVMIEMPIENITKTREQKIDETQIPEVSEISTPTKLVTVSELSNKVKEDSSNDQLKNLNSEAIVSTTNKISEQKIDEKLEPDFLSSTPDSTINTYDMVQYKSCEDRFPDSTIEMNTESSEITSTHDVRNASNEALEPLALNNEGTPQIESIGNLLSILQNKSKIKELLSMLGGKSSDNDKIKKKLEKLSELVSDEDDTNDTAAVDQNKQEEMPNQKELLIVEENIETRDKPALPTSSSEAYLETHEKHIEEAKDAPVQDDPASKEKDTEEHVKTTPVKVVKARSRKKPRKSKLTAEKKIMSTKAKRITRSDASLKAGKPKASRELRQLQNDIKEMFISDDILNATGIRMCRLAKFVDEKPENHDEETNTVTVEPKPVVVLQKFKEKELDDKTFKIRKKPGPKPKSKVAVNENNSDAEKKTEKIKTPPVRRKPGPKSKTKCFREDSDPYAFESDSVSDITAPQPSEDMQYSSDSENESLASSKSFESTEALADLKKKKRKRRSGWSSGVIAKRKKKTETKQKESLENECSPEMLLPKKITFPDISCFVDKTYCFHKNISTYPCRLCNYSGSDIVHHYKKQHPHSEIPLSRMNATVAREAIEQCKDIDFNAMSRLRSQKFTCRFCYKEIHGKRALLETFFWHVVSMHTGEYKQLCPECVNVVPCPFNLDIPPPPKDFKGQLIGYICGKCNFTQISLENLKIHVIVRHNDEQTEVFTINLAIMTKKTLAALTKRQSNVSAPRILRSGTNLSATVASDDSELTYTSYETRESNNDSDIQDIATPKVSVHSKLIFESDNATDLPSENTVKIEKEDNQEMCDDTNSAFEDQAPVSDILDYPHFKITLKDAGAKEYICCINGIDNHYKTALLISMKKHVQTKHSENWDGYCFICKVIVMPQGKHSFRDCLQHMLDKHIDSFPVLANIETISEITVPTEEAQVKISSSGDKTIVEEQSSSTKSYINVRPLSDLMSTEIEKPTAEGDSDTLPKIQKVISLGAPCVESSTPNPTPPVETGMQDMVAPLKPQEEVKYEEAQAEIMSKKHRVVLDVMLVPEKLIQIFKCAGRFCSFTTDSAEAALVHASTHQRIGGENALLCAYCDSDSKGNGIDLITHVFKKHGDCQYTCGHCFYRAAASQLVRAHIIRVHGIQHAQSIVYQNSVAVTTNEDKVNILPRNLAVEYYICAAEGCKFKTFTHGKFIEHLMTKHEPPYLCHICSSLFPSPVELFQHLKTHGLMLYQCTWCVYGAENETELLAHASAKHPSKIPQAYLRVITQKDGNSSKMMVLPLAQLNKSVVQVKVLTPANKIDDPSREAERSIDLEKLIGSVRLSTMDTTATLTAVPVNDLIIECTPPLETDSEIMETISQEPMITDDSDMATLIPEPPRVVTPVVPTEDQNLSQPVLKIEPTDESLTKDKPSSVDIICLDSDEEDSRDSAQNVISLSDDDTSTSKEKPKPDDNYEKFSTSDLYKCPSCSAVFKSPPAFRRHIVMTCLSKSDIYNCAHCPKSVNSLDEFIKHYALDHGACPKLRSKYTKDQRAQNYICGICDRKDSSLYYIKSHLKNYHGVTNVIVASKHSDTGGFLYTVRETPGSKLKRKLSAGSATEQTPPKLKRYSPRDLNELPTRPIFDEPAFCSECEFSTKVLSNLVRHLQQHADAQTVPSTVPVNPVPHLESNEKHFDKMINLASSSIANKSDKSTRNDSTPSVTLLIPPEAAARYPKYVPERQRHTCGAKDCSYISVDEAMLKCHWETLHAGSNSFHCVHCPPRQHLDTSRPLTAARIIGHLKMHDVWLYACSSCSYYHYRRQLVEKHLTENHKGSGQIMVVRQEATNDAGVTQPSPAAPTMDLKPWQCGLCKYRNMFRQEVIEHCLKEHNSKWQFKCPNCPFRGSTLENVSNHQSRVHPESRDDVFYYYYREDSIPHEADGVPRWQKQRQKMFPETKVKTESTENETPVPAATPTISASVTSTPATVDLNLVKKEVADTEIEDCIEQLYKRFGPSCNPNGLKYKCPLCKVVTEDSKDAMQSHLYEELQYRKWGCSICMYKAFHKTGLNEHMFIEHSIRQITKHEEFIELPTNVNIEKWVTNVLDHQTDIIAKSKENLAKQKIQVPNTDAMSKAPIKTTQTSENVNFGGNDIEKLSEAFGKFGSPKNIEFCCPKCDLQTRDESEIKNHLELELNKIRWRCSSCSDYSQNYHEAQLHCKTCKNLRPGQSARPMEAVRDPNMRAAWVDAVIHVQKQTMKQTEDSSTFSSNDDQSNPLGTTENSLLTVRYVEKVPTPEEEMLKRKKGTPYTSTDPPAATILDSDDERLVIDEPATVEIETRTTKKIEAKKKCKYCDFATKYSNAMYTHTLRHYNLMPYKCAYCALSCHKTSLTNHFANHHPDEPEKYTKTVLPTGPPIIINLDGKRYRKSLTVDIHTHRKEKEICESAPKKEEVKPKEDGPKNVCLVCEKTVSESEKSSHFHDKIPVTYAKKGGVVVKCCICLALLIDSNAMQEHHTANHPDMSINYAYFKLNHDTREIHHCGHCQKGFKFIRDLRTHHNTLHCSLTFKAETKPYTPGSHDLLDNEQETTSCVKRENNVHSIPPLPKRVAMKSTTKLPNRIVARKSTTKLPVAFDDSDTELDEFSYYGTKPTPTGQLDKVNMVMSLSNTMMPMSMTLRKLSELMEIDPKVVVEDCNK